MGGIRRAGVCVALALVLVPVAGGAPRIGTVPFGPTPASLSVDSVQSLGTSVSVATSTSPTAAPVARIAVYVPSGYTLRTPAVGTSIGFAFLLNGSAATGSDLSPVSGTLKIADPATVDPAAQTCDPVTHAAIWALTMSDTASTATVPVFVDATGAGDPPGASFRIQFCPTAPSGVRLLLADLLVRSSVLVEPTAPALYVWRAFMTPAGAGTTPADPSQTYEARAVLPLPQQLTLHAEYNAKTKRVTLTGELTALGQPKAGVPITLDAHSAHVELADFGPARTNSAGRYSITWPISEKTEFTASVDDAPPAACAPDPGTPPAGCASQTTSAPPQAQATARPPRRGDPKPQPTAADRALAARVNAKLTDFPSGWEAESQGDDGAVLCPDVQPDESKLTLTGTSSSPYFYEDDESSGKVAQIALSTVKVWKTAADAKVAFARETPATALKCVLKDPKTTIVKASALASPRLGRASSTYRIVIVDKDEDGNQVTSYLDVVEVLGRRSLATMTFAALGAPPTIEQQVSRAVAGRAAGA